MATVSRRFVKISVLILFAGLILWWLSLDEGIQPVVVQILQQPVFSTPSYANSTKSTREHLLRACEFGMLEYVKEFGDSFGLKRGIWYISNNLKLVYCEIRKAGSSNIARVLATLDNISDYTDTNKVKGNFAKTSVLLLTNNRTEEAFGTHYEQYKKFMIVRDPLERLLSAYRDRKPAGFFHEGQLTFKEYLERIVSIPDKKTNLHVTSFTRVCNPCRIKYDFIGFVDNFEDDLRNVIELVGFSSNIVLPKRNQTGYKQTKSGTVLREYLEDVPETLIHKVYEHYYWDYFLFGFSKPDV